MASNSNDPPQYPHHHHQQPNSATIATAAAAAAAAAAVSGSGTAPGGHPVFDLPKFWHEQIAIADNGEPDFKNHPLPLARIKKVMKTDQDVKMISAEAPILFAKGCEIFITELTKRAWVHAEENKRRTLQRSDIATAISKTDMCDFLIDIVPREEASKASSAAVYDQQQNYASYYQQPAGLPSFAPPGQVPQQQQMEAAYYPPSLSQLTPEQVQQYQLHFQQFAAQQQQQQHQQQQQQQQHQQQQHPYAPHHALPEHQARNQPAQSSTNSSRSDESHE